MRFKKILQYSLITIFVLLIIKYFLVHKEELSLIAKISLNDFLILLAVTLAVNIIYAHRLFLILRNLGLKQMSYLYWLKIFAVSRFINFHITQGAIVYRGVKLKKDFGFSYTASISTNVYFAWLESVTNIAIALVLILILNPRMTIAGVNICAVLTSIFILFLILPNLLKLIKFSMTNAESKLSWISGRLASFQNSMEKGIKDVKLILSVSFFNILTFVLQTLWLYFCCRALALHLEIYQLIVIAIAFQVSAVFKIIPGNFGVKEVIGGFLTESFGLSFGSGIIISGISRVVIYLTVGILGLIFSRIPLQIGKSS